MCYSWGTGRLINFHTRLLIAGYSVIGWKAILAGSAWLIHYLIARGNSSESASGVGGIK